MFKHSFSFNGRIRRTEYAFTFLLIILLLAVFYTVIYLIIQYGGDALVKESTTNYGGGYYSFALTEKKPSSLTQIIIVTMLVFINWFYWAQGAKRCHDLGKSGWWQFIPFYHFWLLFAKGKAGSNEYGEDPKIKANIS